MRAESMFYIMPREVGNPYRRRVNSVKELLEFVNENNYVNPVFVSLYPLDLTVDKIFFDIDSKFPEKSLEEAKKLIDNIESLRLDYIPIFSGRKGFHIYVICKPMKITGKQLRKIQEYISDGVNADTHCFGDLRRLVRFPNTYHTSCYAVPLPLDFVDMDINEIIDYAKSPKVVDYYPRPRDLSDFIEDQEIEELPQVATEQCKTLPIANPELFVRPCVLNTLKSVREPPHIIRFALVCELMWSGFDEESIFRFIKENFEWQDFDETITRQQISYIFANRYFPPACDKISPHVRPELCQKCNFRFSKYFLEVV